jgi:hypothetical protein
MQCLIDACSAGYDQQQTMFVGVVEAVENRKRVIFRSPCHIRLSILDNCLRSSGNAVYHSPLTGRFEFLNSSADGKPYSVWGIGSSLESQGPDEMVQAGPKVMDDLTSNNGEFERNRNRTRSGEDVLRKIGIELTNDFVWVLPKESSNFGFERLDVLVGPINLRPTPIEWM